MTIALAEGIALSLRPQGYDRKSWFASSSIAMGRQLINLVPISLIGPVFAIAWTHRIYTVDLGACGASLCC